MSKPTESSMFFLMENTKINKYCKEYLATLKLVPVGRIVQHVDKNKKETFYLHATFDNKNLTELEYALAIESIREHFNSHDHISSHKQNISRFEFYITQENFMNLNFVRSLRGLEKFKL